MNLVLTVLYKTDTKAKEGAVLNAVDELQDKLGEDYQVTSTHWEATTNIEIDSIYQVVHAPILQTIAEVLKRHGIQ